MKFISLLLISSFFFLGCSSQPQSTQNSEPKLVVGKDLSHITLNDQFGTAHQIEPNTKTVVFAFSKDTAHLCNDYFSAHNPTFLANKNAVFIADISAVPSLIRTMFVQPGLKDLTHRVLLIEDDATSADFKTAANAESVVIAHLKAGVIQDITLISTKEELAGAL